MKNRYINIGKRLAIAFLVASAIISCNTFESEPLNRFKEDNVFDIKEITGTKTIGALNGIYEALPILHNRLDGSYLDAGTDDALPTIIRATETCVYISKK